MYNLKELFLLPIAKRKMICVSLGLLFWLLCCYLASNSNPDIRWTPMMWSIIYNRVLIWIFVMLFGFVNYYQFFSIRLLPALRWAIAWFWVSLDLAIGIHIIPTENAWTIFWLTLIAWIIYWMIIDLVATKFSWDWEVLMKWLIKNK